MNTTEQIVKKKTSSNWNFRITKIWKTNIDKLTDDSHNVGILTQTSK
jgi:hypothetical protein